MILFSELSKVGDAVPIRDQQRIVNCHQLKVPDHIWDSLALRQGMPYHMVLYENRKGILGNEIVCTARDPGQWPNLWRLKIAFGDETGLLADLTELLREFKLNIVSCRAETTEPEGIVNFELLLDSQDYTINHPERIRHVRGGSGETLPEVRARILATFIEHIEFYNEEPLFSLRRVPQLVIAHDKIRRDPPHDPHFLPLGHRSVPVPVRFLERIRGTLAAEYPEVHTRDSGAARAAMRADTEAGVVRIMILFPHTQHLALNIVHEDRTGTLFVISQFMKSQRLNLLQLSTDRTAVLDTAVTKVILTVPKEVAVVRSRADAEAIADWIKTVDLVHDCDVDWEGV
jgi:glycine cleavage system regulatory protein